MITNMTSDTFDVWVPNPLGALLTHIAKGSGIVSNVVGLDVPDHKTVDYEGNLYGAMNIVTYADRVYHAAGRSLANYPTRARALIPKNALVLVGHFNYTTRALVITNPDALAHWLDLNPADLFFELSVSR